jgi:hypothetical protein
VATQDFMGSTYNEIVIDPHALEAHLPQSVLAVFFPAGCEWCRTEAEGVHARFLRDYRLSAERFPLLEYSQPPHFRCVKCT